MKKTKKTLMTAAALCAAANIGTLAAPMGVEAIGSGNVKDGYIVDAEEIPYVSDLEGDKGVLDLITPYKPDVDRVPVVYGPPDSFDKDIFKKADDSSTVDENDTDDIKKDDTDDSKVIDGPEKFEPADSLVELLYGPPDPYDPEEPFPDLYGPPEWYEDGDVTGDGNVDIEDAVNTLGFISGNTSFTSQQERSADVNNDGKVDIEDVVSVINQINGIKPIE